MTKNNWVYSSVSKSRVNKAGKNVRLGVETAEDLNVIETWRASHAYVLNTFQMALRRKVREKSIVVAQRLKRRNTIFGKARREIGMDLARMHDVAGCRLIFPTIEDLYKFRTFFHSSKFGHKRRNEIDSYDYIKSPKSSGYRGIHDVYEHSVGSEAGSKWNGLLVEIQYRTEVQHAWSTSVEIAGFITENQPKFNEGDERYKLFFKLSSEIMARSHEDRASCFPDMPNAELVAAFEGVEQQIGLLRTLKLINQSDRVISTGKNVILTFSTVSKEPVAETFETLASAVQRYFELEKSTPTADIVLVRADSTESIKQAFRNYFSDTKQFVVLLSSGIKNLTTR